MEKERLKWLKHVEDWLLTEEAECGQDAVVERERLIVALKTLNYEWDYLLDAYGSASEVPVVLLKLTSDNPEVRERAILTLYTTVFHQGMRTLSAVYVVSFLFHLLLSEKVHSKEEIIDYLVHLAIGYPEESLPEGVEPAAMRQAADDAEQGMTREQRGAYLYEYYSLRVEVLCYQEVFRQLDILMPLTHDSDPIIRKSAIFALAWFPEQAEQSLIHILDQLESETEDAAVANAILAAGLLIYQAGLSPELLKLEKYRGEAFGPLVRMAVAIVHGRFSLNRESIDLLLASLCEADQLNQFHREDIQFYDGWFVSYVIEILTCGSVESQKEVVLSLCNRIGTYQKIESSSVRYAILDLLNQVQDDVYSENINLLVACGFPEQKADLFKLN